MLTNTSRETTLPLPPRTAHTFVLTLFVCIAGMVARGHCAEPLYPIALMNWMSEGTFHALIVDKSQQRLTVWRIKDGEPALIDSLRCSTGENSGDKWVRGDMRTPEGVYLFCSVIDGKTLPGKYGLWAFTTDYPNFVDRRRGKNGDGIWLHGRDKPLAEKPDSNGCVALENDDLLRISRYVRLQSTPMIVVDKMIMAPRSRIMEQERAVRDFLESWRQAWESRDLDGYMGHYSPNFQSCWLDYNGWKEKKRKLNKRYSRIKVRLGDVYLYRQDGLITAIFTQSYTSDSFSSSGIKILYLTHKDKYAIYAEDYHQPVDEAYPVGSLIARAGGQPGWSPEDTKDFRIRLVSTDEPEQIPYGETETPRPSAPSRGVVLERIALGASANLAAPALETNDRIDATSSERLTVTNLASGDVPMIEASHKRRLAGKVVEPAVPADSTAAPQDKRLAAALPAADVKDFHAGFNQPATSPHTVQPKEPELPVDQEFDTAENPGNPEKQRVMLFLHKWKDAWQQKDLDRYAKMYHPNFGQGTISWSSFLKTRRNFLRKYRNIQVNIGRVEIKKVNGQLLVRFVQTFRGDDYSDKGWKRLVLAGSEDKGFRILAEDWSPL